MENFYPFRWNISKRNEIGMLTEAVSVEIPEQFITDLVEFSAKVLESSQNGELYFVGRSLESCYDFLAGALRDTEWESKNKLLQFSTRLNTFEDIKAQNPSLLTSLHQYWDSLALSPKDIASKTYNTCFVDLVSTGGSFKTLVEILHDYCLSRNYDWNAVRRRIFLIGLVARTKNSPNTWRWQQHAEWLSALGMNKVKNISASPDFYHYVGDVQEKVTPSYFFNRWGAEEFASPSRYSPHLKGLKIALTLYEYGASKEGKAALRKAMTKTEGMQEKWFRDLLGMI